MKGPYLKQGPQGGLCLFPKPSGKETRREPSHKASVHFTPPSPVTPAQAGSSMHAL